MRPFLIGIAVLLGLALAGVAALPWLAEPALRAGLRLAQPDADFERLRLDWHDLEIDGIALGPEQRLSRLRVVWRWPEVLGGRLARVEIDGLVMHAAWRDGRLHLAGIETSPSGETPLAPLPDVAEVLLRDARFELSTAQGRLLVPLAARIRPSGGRLAFEVTIDNARLDGSEGAVVASGSFEGDLSRDAPLSIERAKVKGTVEVAAEQATLGTVHGIDGEARIELAADGGLDGADGTLSLELSDAGFATPDLTASGGALRQRLDWRYAGDRLILRVDAPGALAIESLAGDDLRAGPLRMRLEATDRPLLTLDLEQGGLAGWHQSIAAVIETAEARLAAPLPLQLQSEAGTITLALEGAGQSLGHAEIGLAGGQLRLPDPALTLEGIASELALTATGLAPDQTIPIAIERISQGGHPAWFAPLALQGTLSPGAEALAFDGALTGIGAGLTLNVHGEQRPSGAGTATVEVAPIAFGPHLQPEDLTPLAAGVVSEVAGRLALNGELTWDDGGIASDLAILVEQLGLTSGPARLEQINGVVRLDRLWPPTTPPRQQLAIGLLDLGLPLTDGLTTFRLTEGPRLDVEQLEWRLAGGTARAEPFTLGSPLAGLNVTLRAEQLDLGQLLALTRMDGVSGKGKLDGVLPLRVAGGVAIIEGGELSATGPGVLRYAAGAAPEALREGGEGVDLLLQALENFHYEALRITLDGRTDAAMDIGLHVAGANPDLYDGHPIEFNLNLEGELANILRQGVASYQIPDRIRERMQGFRR